MSSGPTVVVVCKLKHGLWLEVGYDHNTGIRGEKYARVKINGANQALVAGSPHTSEGVGITTGVPKEVWDEWLKIHKNLPYVVNGLLSAQPEIKSANDAAKEVDGEKTGMEPLGQTDPRVKDADLRSKIKPYAANT